MKQKQLYHYSKLHGGELTQKQNDDKVNVITNITVISMTCRLIKNASDSKITNKLICETGYHAGNRSLLIMWPDIKQFWKQ